MIFFEEPENFRSSQTNQEMMIREQVDCQEGELRPTPSQHLPQLPPGSSLTLTPKNDRDVDFTYIDNKKLGEYISNILTDGGESSKGVIIRSMSKEMPIVDSCYQPTKHEELGRGTYGTCTKCTDNNTKFPFAKKTIKKDRQLFIHEAVTLSRLDHRNIVKLYGVQWNSKTKQSDILIEYIKGDTLDKFLEKYRERKETLDPNLCFDIFKKVLVAIDHCHARDVVHGDIHTGNIMVRLEKSLPVIVKLIDVGNNREKSRSDDIRNVVQVFQSMLRSTYKRYWSTENEKFKNTGLPRWIYTVLDIPDKNSWDPSAKDILDKIPGDTEDSNPDTCLDEIEQ